MNSEIKILFLEDLATDVELNILELEKAGFDISSEVVETKPDFVSSLEEFNPDIILADYTLPKYSGMDALDYILANNINTPFIFVTGTMGEDVAVEAVKHGATDYVLKQNLVRLAPSVKRALSEAGERKKRETAENALRESEEKFRSIFETAPDLIITMNRKTDIVNCNHKIGQYLGYTLDEVLGRPITDLVHPDYYNKALDFMKEVIIEGYSNNKECKMVRKDGSFIDVKVNSAVLRRGKNKEELTLCIIDDITEQKLAEEALRKSEIKFRTLTENIPDVIARFDTDLRYIYVNPAIEKATGLSQHEFLGKTSEELGMPEKNNIIWNEKKLSVFRTAEPRDFEFDLPSPEGIRYFSSLIVPEFGDDGTVRTILMVSHDITERILAEEALRESERRFSTVFHASPLAIAITRLKNNNFIDVNEAWQKITGYGKEETAGKTPLELNTWADPEMRNKLIETLKNHNSVNDFEFKLRHKSGNIFDLLLAAEIINISDEPCLLTISLDITERKRMEEELRITLKEKEVLIHELYHRTFNNMQVIIGMLRMQADYFEDEKIKTVFNEMISRIYSISRVHQKLYHSKNLSAINLKEYVIELADSIRQSYTRPDIEFIMKLDDEWVYVSTAIPFSMVFNEILSKIFKNYGRINEKNIITIGLRRVRTGMMELSFSGNKLLIPDGFGITQENDLGFKIIREITEQQMNGSVDYCDQTGQIAVICFKDNLYDDRI